MNRNTYKPVRPTQRQKDNAMAFQAPDSRDMQGRQLTVEEQWAMSRAGQDAMTHAAATAMLDRTIEKAAFAAREQEQERQASMSDIRDDLPWQTPQPTFQLAPSVPAPGYAHYGPGVEVQLRPDQAAIAGDRVKAFALAGTAVFTVVSKKTGARFTYKVRKSDDGRMHFVDVLTGPQNTSDYTYLGCIFGDNSFRHGRKSRIGFNAPSTTAFEWFWNQAVRFGKLDQVDVYHEGRCCRCGRALTVPESIAAGIGPECASKGA